MEETRSLAVNQSTEEQAEFLHASIVDNAFVQARRLRQKTPVGEKKAAQTKSPGNRLVKVRRRGEPAVTPSGYRVGQGRSSTSDCHNLVYVRLSRNRKPRI